MLHLTMYKNNSRDSVELKSCITLQLFCILTRKYHASATILILTVMSPSGDNPTRNIIYFN